MQKNDYLKEIGIAVWRERTPCESSSITLESLRLDVAACTACDLHRSRTQTVFGVGNPNAKIMFIGEAPGFSEDQQGEPFVGRAGKLLTAMLHAIGLSRESVFIVNILKCRPPNNRDPSLEEVEACTPFLQKQIELIPANIIVALGRIAAHYLLKTDLPMNRLRGKEHEFPGLRSPVMVTYHPAYLLRSPIEKAKAWEDFQRLKNYV